MILKRQSIKNGERMNANNIKNEQDEFYLIKEEILNKKEIMDYILDEIHRTNRMNELYKQSYEKIESYFNNKIQHLLEIKIGKASMISTQDEIDHEAEKLLDLRRDMMVILLAIKRSSIKLKKILENFNHPKER